MPAIEPAAQAATVAAEPAKQKKKCSIERALPRTLQDLVRLAPDNPIVRGLLMQALKVMPPKKLETYEELKEWIEYNCEGRKYIPAEGSQPITQGVQVTAKRVEEGTACYTQQMQCSCGISFDEEELMPVLEEVVRQETSRSRRRSALVGKLKEIAIVKARTMEDRIVPNMQGGAVSIREKKEVSVGEVSYDCAPTISNLRDYVYYRYPTLYDEIFRD